ncbi:glutathione S-transferase 1 [Ditylenchus destructor]|nr:glutathione S-transferase 1 [Ditylenchus destructor]
MIGTHSYKFSYFDVRALGEPIRLLFHYVGQPFQDERVDRNEWNEDWSKDRTGNKECEWNQNRKAKTPFGKLPLLEVDGGKVVITQSSAIARFIAEKNGLAGKDDV